jgi:hypothetical protein
MTSRAGGGDWGEEPTANLRLNKAHVIKRAPTAPVEKPVERATQELAKLEVEALLADPLITQRVTDSHVAIEILDEVPGPIAAASINQLAYTSALTPKLGIQRIPRGADLADGSQRLELDSIPSASVAQGTGAVIAVGPAEVASGPLRKVPPLEDRLALGTDPMIPLERPIAREPEPPQEPMSAQRGPWSDLVIGFGFGAVLLAIAVLAATYAL